MVSKMKKGVCESCGVIDRDTMLYTAAGPVDVVSDELSPIGFVVVPVQELCAICATLEGVAAPEITDKVREYTDLMKVSVELPAQTGLVGPSSHPVAPEPLDDILVTRESELEGKALTHEGTPVAPRTITPSALVGEEEEEEEIFPPSEEPEESEELKEEDWGRIGRVLRKLLMEM